MNKLIYILFIVLSGCIVGSSSIAETTTNTKASLPLQQQELAQNNAGPESIVTMRVKQVLTYQNLKLRVVAVEDSRCALGVACIWAGQLVVTLEVSNEHQEKEEVKLIRKREPEMANAFGYSFLLLTVEPHPKKGKEIQLSEQVITVKIIKMND